MKSTTCEDCDYNILKQYVKINELLWNIDSYIIQARKAKHKDCVAVLEKMKKDGIKNAEALKKLIIKKASTW